MAEIASILGRHQISIASIIQHETDEEDGSDVVPLVIMTHTAPEGNMRRPWRRSAVLSPAVHPGSVRMRVRD